jgi:hypothetical protein
MAITFAPLEEMELRFEVRRLLLVARPFGEEV